MAPVGWPPDKEPPSPNPTPPNTVGTPGHITPRGWALSRQTPPISPPHSFLVYSPPLALPPLCLSSPPPHHALSFTPPPRLSLLRRHQPLFLSAIEPNYNPTQDSSFRPSLGSEGHLGKMKYLSRENVLEHHNVGPDASSNTDNRRVPICNLGAFSGMGVNKDPRPNIDRVYVSCLHIFSRLSMPLKTESKKKKRNMVQKKNGNADPKKGRKKNPRC